jgi:hypothetical protein
MLLTPTPRRPPGELPTHRTPFLLSQTPPASKTPGIADSRPFFQHIAGEYLTASPGLFQHIAGEYRAVRSSQAVLAAP